jgi:rhodanese-related sulfurtransferase
MFRIFNRVRPFMDMSSSDFEKAIRTYPDAVIIDVRTPEEFNIGRIPGSINMDITRGDFESWVSDLDRDTTYLIYCRGGNRSIAACTIFGSKGLRSCNLAGGIYTWNGPMEGSV